MHGVLEDHSSPLKFWVSPKVTNFLPLAFLIQPKISSPPPTKIFGGWHHGICVFHTIVNRQHPPWLSGGKDFKYKICSDGLKQPFPNFLFPKRATFSLFLSQKFKQKQFFSFLFPTINSDIILQESGIAFYFTVFYKKLFWRKFLNKFPSA